ncbi:MAG: type II toxin-antitoxin system VapB family antitoxin [Chthoniobacterales bacterium]
MAVVPYPARAMMKMTMFIDETLLERVMKLTGLKTKTETIEFALREAERKSKLGKFLGRRKLEAKEWKESLDPAYDLMALRLAETPGKYRTKRGSR